jgi:hypothetical protein
MESNMKTTVTLLSLAFLMGTALNFSVAADDPSEGVTDPSFERGQPTMDDVAWSGGHFPGAVMVPRGFTKPAMPHAVGGFGGAIPLKHLDPTELEARKNSMGTNTLTCVPGIDC